MSDFKIDKDVPMPKTNGYAHPKYPWLEMEVGDSFVIEDKKDNGTLAYAASGQASKRFAPKRFTCRKVEPTTFRIWRVA